jgi:glycine dehydrogenase subunit 1
MALRAGVYLSWMGAQGLKRIAELCFNRAVYLSKLLLNIPGVELITQGSFFREFCIRLPSDILVESFLKRLAAHGFDGGVALSRFDPKNTRDLLIAVTELNDREALNAFAEVVELMLTNKITGRKQ